MDQSLLIDPSRCTGCKQCEIACSFEKEGEFNVSKSRIRVFDFHSEGRFVPYTCTQCSQAWCQKVCPVGAIVTGESGEKVVTDSICVGCRICIISCPFGTINYNKSTGKAVKCDLCSGKPACVSACPTAALSFRDSEQAGYDKMQAWAYKTRTGSEESPGATTPPAHRQD